MPDGLCRLNKLLASWGIASRRGIEKMIGDDRIKVDGETVRDPGRQVDPSTAVISVDGRRVTAPEPSGPVVVAINKPAGVVSTLRDPFGRPTIRDFLPRSPRLFPIGRLDQDSTGLLLATDHGGLSNRLLHPRYKVEKSYQVRINGAPLSDDELERFRSGIILVDGTTAPCRISLSGGDSYRVDLREGRKRQIRRMFEALDRTVVSLHRTRFGPVDLGRLAPGSCRRLTTDETARLFEAAGLGKPGFDDDDR